MTLSISDLSSIPNQFLKDDISEYLVIISKVGEKATIISEISSVLAVR